MDLSTILGICAAFGLMLMAILQGGPLSIFINIPSIMIVFGGTAGNILVHYPFADVFDAINVAKKTFRYKETSPSALIDQLMDFANKARKEAMGMVGTLIGLVQMLQTMDDPATIGPAMAVALLTTFYGAVIANVVCTPMAGKLRNRSQSEILTKTLIAEGMQSILAGENPRIMEQKLHAFIAPKLRDSAFNK